MRNMVMSLLVMFVACLLSFSSVHAEITGPSLSFSADFVATGESSGQGKMYAAPEGVRIEGVSDGQPYVMIMNFPRQMVWTVMEEERMYLEWQSDAAKEQMADYAGDGPCGGYDGAGTRLGRETLHGRTVEKWSCEHSEGSAMIWFDEKLQMPVRTEEAGETFELRNIKEEQLAKDLFLPPRGYEKMDMSMMMRMGMPDGGSRSQQRTDAPASRGTAVDPEEKKGVDRDDVVKGIREGLRGIMGR